MKKIVLLTALAALTVTGWSQSALQWESVAPGIWKAKVGQPEKLDLYHAAGVAPRQDALLSMGSVDFPIKREDINATQTDGKVYLHFPLDSTERIFGLGLNFKTVDQRGRILRLHMDHYGGRDDGRNHAPVPLYVSSKGYGVLINSARYIDVWVGTAVQRDSKNPPEVRDRNTNPNWSANPHSDNIEMLVPAQGTEIIVFGGPSMMDAVRRYNLFNGGGCLPPKWGLGFWHRTPTLYNEQDVLTEVQQYKEKNFPLTVIGLEPGWQSIAYPCSYEWDKTRFPNPQRLVDSLKKQGVETNLWINPYVVPDGTLGKQIVPYTASHNVWTGLVPDYMVPEARQLIANHFNKNVLDIGVSGFKMDENDGFDEWLWPDVARFPSGHTAEQQRQTYAVMMQKLTTDLYRSRNRRTYGLVRGSNAGASSFPYVIYNDYYSHPDFITALVNSSFIGVLWTPEVRASKTGEEWLRRMQTVCFSPLAMLNAWADGTKPWSFPEVTSQVQDIAHLRMQLIPYLYTSYADYAFYGTPPVKAMNLLPGFDIRQENQTGVLSSTENPYAKAVRKEIKDQFVVGDELLVAPLFAGQVERQVILPAGKWYDFYTGEYAGEQEVITVKPGLDKIPVYVRDGAIIPMFPKGEFNLSSKQPLEIRYYGKSDGRYMLYDDDGESYDYEKGNYTRITLEVKKNKKGKPEGKVIVPKGSKLWSYGSFTWKYMSDQK